MVKNLEVGEAVENGSIHSDIIDSANKHDEYLLINANGPLTNAMGISALGFDDSDALNHNIGETDNDNDIISTFNHSILNRRSHFTNFHNDNERKEKGKEEEKDENNPSSSTLTKQETLFWSPHMKEERKKVFFHFLFINFIIMIFCFTVLVIIWGATYKTSKYYHRIKIIALIQDDDISIYNGTIVSMVKSIPELISNLPGTWHIFNSSTFSQRFNVSENDMNQRIIKLVYDEKYWLALNIKPNVTQSLYNSLTNIDSKPFNSTDFFQIIYESARDPLHVDGFMLPIMQSLQSQYQTFYSKEYILSFMDNITLTNFDNVPHSGYINFEFLDYRAYYDRILFIVAQIACVFALIFTVFQFIAYSKLHGEVTSLVKKRHKVYYRVGLSALTHFISSLLWCTVHAVYHVDFTKAFGRGGFMVCWMTTWLFMWAVGGINENVLSVIFAINPPYLGFWVLGFVIINIASTFFPFVLDSAFYRYGYFMPLHNFVAITRVIFMDLSKHHMGRNYGVLLAWIGLNTALLPFDMKLVDWLVKRNKKK